MVNLFLRILVLAVMILQIFNRNFENVFLCLLTLVLLIVPSLIQVNFIGAAVFSVIGYFYVKNRGEG